jgi:hypothetical protein
MTLMPSEDALCLWLWEYTNERGKRRASTWRMTEAEAARYKDAVKVAGSLERRPRLGSTSAWQKTALSGR